MTDDCAYGVRIVRGTELSAHYGDDEIHGRTVQGGFQVRVGDARGRIGRRAIDLEMSGRHRRPARA